MKSSHYHLWKFYTVINKRYNDILYDYYDSGCPSDLMMMFAFYKSSMNTEMAPQPQLFEQFEQWGSHWKSVVVITAEAALRCLSLAAVSFWHRASSKLAAALWTKPRHSGPSMAYPSRSLVDVAPLEIGFDCVFIPQFWSTLVSFADLEFPVYQASRHPTLLHSNHVSKPIKVGPGWWWPLCWWT